MLINPITRGRILLLLTWLQISSWLNQIEFNGIIDFLYIDFHGAQRFIRNPYVVKVLLKLKPIIILIVIVMAIPLLISYKLYPLLFAVIIIRLL